MTPYAAFLDRKSHIGGEHGFAPTHRNPMCFDFQTAMVDWACRQGRAALFEDCGLGKTLQEMAWAQNVVEHTNRPVLMAAPLSVSMQMVREGEKFGYDVRRSLDGAVPTGCDIVTTNYERLHRFDPDAFAGFVGDESSVLKNFDGARRAEITRFLRKMKYRLLCSATPSPNDYIELGTSSEALGFLGHMDMLGRFFKNDEDSLHPAFIGSKWRFKSHAERDFWRWLCSWARAMRRPSDLGFNDGPFVLPPLVERDIVVPSAVRDGQLFAMPAATLSEEREERRATMRARCEAAAMVIAEAPSGVAWCHLNDEADMLVDMIPGAMQVAGSQSEEEKEELLEAFRTGEIRRLVTKPKLAALGLNWQHCADMTFFTDHSFEQYYQAVRRMYRFGRVRPVNVTSIATEGLSAVARNRARKAAACEAMFARLVEQMNDALQVRRHAEHAGRMELPTWLC